MLLSVAIATKFVFVDKYPLIESIQASGQN